MDFVYQFFGQVKEENIMKKKIALVIIALLVMVLLVTGCQITYPKKAMINGGGWIAAPVTMVPEMAGDTLNEKATFGFEVQIYNLVVEDDVLVDFDVKGHLTYIDHVAGVKVIGKVTDFDMVEEGFTGTFGDGCTFLFYPIDNEGTGNPDEFFITLSTGYMNEGIVEGGNIQTISVYE